MVEKQIIIHLEEKLGHIKKEWLFVSMFLWLMDKLSMISVIIEVKATSYHF